MVTLNEVMRALILLRDEDMAATAERDQELDQALASLQRRVEVLERPWWALWLRWARWLGWA